MQSQSIRLNKFLAERLGLSRREADDAIASGKVLVDDKPAALGARVDKNSKVCYNKKVVPFEVAFLMSLLISRLDLFVRVEHRAMLRRFIPFCQQIFKN